jgi:hypothetical protein
MNAEQRRESFVSPDWLIEGISDDEHFTGSHAELIQAAIEFADGWDRVAEMMWDSRDSLITEWRKEGLIASPDDEAEDDDASLQSDDGDEARG